MAGAEHFLTDTLIERLSRECVENIKCAICLNLTRAGRGILHCLEISIMCFLAVYQCDKKEANEGNLCMAKNPSQLDVDSASKLFTPDDWNICA